MIGIQTMRRAALPRTYLPYWAVIRTKTGLEKFALEQIKSAKHDAEVFLPRMKETHSPILKPLFPGYLFVRIDHEWGYLMNCPGVQEVLRTGKRPHRCSDKVMKALIREQGKDGYIDMSPRIFHPQVGDVVKIKVGLFKDFLGRYKSNVADHRIIAAVGFLGREYEVELREREIDEPTVADLKRHRVRSLSKTQTSGKSERLRFD